eukprot:gnl/Trimastix_PCT/1510.p1 GENE.gnl/Trimastix_PCT/1510~~gnl/Trimastix_PCT/1510.p1  ORF type:complete len:548 (+),score=138.90 gnl/Trimastix_PCT/1510:59-1702(+)
MFLSFFGLFAVILSLLYIPLLKGKKIWEYMVMLMSMLTSPWIHSFMFSPVQHHSFKWAYLFLPSETSPFWLSYVHYGFIFGFITCALRLLTTLRHDIGNSSNCLWWWIHWIFIHIPGSIFACTIVLSVPWVLVLRLVILDPAVLHPWLQIMLFAPILLACLTGICFSSMTRTRTRHLVYRPTATMKRAPKRRKRYRAALSKHAPPGVPDLTLKIVQLTDIHLGSWMTPRRARRICQAAVDAQPDLILITGDFLTSDWKLSWNRTFAALSRALEPLSQMGPGRVFACMGNHDYEFPELVPRVLAHVGVQLLRNQEAIVSLVPGHASAPAHVLSHTPPTRLTSPLCVPFSGRLRKHPPPPTHATYTVLDSAPAREVRPPTPALEPPSVDPAAGHEAGRVTLQVVGFEYYGQTPQARSKHLARILPGIPARSPHGRASGLGFQAGARAGADRGEASTCAATLVLAHDPAMVSAMPKDYGCVMFSGHTHGGQISLQVFGVPGSLIGLVIPDRGPFAYGSNLMYVHGCTGFYGFPLRIGTPSEQGPMHLYIY